MGRNFPTDSSFTPSPTEVADTDYFPVAVTGDVVKRVPMSTVRASVIGAPDGSTPGSVLARLDTAEDDIASLGAAVGPLPVAIDALQEIVGSVRTVTGNATLDGDEGVVIIDAAGAVEITLDAGAAARRVRVLRIGDASLYATVFLRDGGTGTINGAASSYTVYGTTTAGISIDLWATAAHEWHTSTTVYETLAELVGTTIPALDTRVGDLEGRTTGLLLAIGWLATPFASSRKAADGAGATGTWDSSEDSYYQVTYAAATHVLTLDADGWDDGAVGQLEILNAGGFGVEVVLANPAHTLNGMSAGTGYTLLPGSDIVPSSTVLPARFQVVYYGSGAWGIG